jgi:two-component system response regulator YesN
MLKILLVEDNQIFRKLFKESFCGCFPSLLIEEAADGKEALQKVKGNPPDFVFIDMNMPGMHGLQLTQAIKKDFPNIPIAILTGYDLPEYKQAALQSGAERFFVKGTLMWKEIEEFLGAMV